MIMCRDAVHATNPRVHVVRAIDHHPFGCQFFNHRRVQLALRIVKLEVKRRLVVDDDVEDVWALGFRPCGAGQKQDRESKEDSFHSRFTCPGV